MNRLSIFALLALSPLAQAQTATPDAFIDTFAKLFGDHQGERKNHIKGICAAGEFKALPAARNYSKISWLNGQPQTVTARFSLAGGNPKAPDNARSPRGMALELAGANGVSQHFTMLNTPVFAASTPETFLGLLQSLLPDPATGKPDMAKVAQFKASHPDTKPHADYLASHTPPWSYATSAYFGIHTFFITDNQGKEHKVRWQFVPADGVKGLSDAELAAGQGDFLHSRLLQRLQQGPVLWTMQLVLGQEGDSETDPAAAWPADRPTLDVAQLSLSTVGGDGCRAINFDPNLLSAGVRASADPVLAMRSPAYAISFGKRLTGN